MAAPNKKKSPARIRFEKMASDLFAVPKGDVEKAEAERLKRPHPNRKAT